VEDTTAAIVLAGSYVWSEDSLELLCPRALLAIANAPLLTYVLDWLRTAGVRVAVICANNEAVLLQQYLGEGQREGLSLYYYVDRIPRGPAGCSRDASALVDAERYIVVEGSIIPGVALRPLLKSHLRSCAALTVVVEKVVHDEEHAGGQLSPAGVYVFARRALEQVPPVSYQDIKEMLVPHLRRNQELVLAYPAERASPRVTGLESYVAVQGWMLARCSDGQVVFEGYERFDGACVHRSARVAKSTQLIGPVMVGPESFIEAGTVVIGPTVIGRQCLIGERAVVARAILWDRSSVGRAARVDRCLVASGASIPTGVAKYGLICQADAAT
jgi:NDP-sugar pyrophosphorylase family protein